MSVISSVPIRRFRVIVDLQDPFRPPVVDQELKKPADEDEGKYKAISIEVVTCPEDHQPTLIYECGDCPKFVRRYGEKIYHTL